LQTILGANGVIAVQLAKSLLQYTDKIRLVSRNPKKVNQNDEIISANLLNADQIENAVSGSEVVYLTAGLPYKIKVWRAQWPVIMRNVINACKKHNSKLIFFDNVYVYGRVNGWMYEDTPMKPVSKKGEVRRQIAEMILDEISKGNLTAIIARAADFYGPNTPLSFVDALVFQKLKAGKKAQWMINDKVKHSFTYTPDAGKATAILGNSDSAYNRVWHLPTDKNALTGKEFIEKAATEFKVNPNHSVLPKWTLQSAGLFNSIVKESIEMLYQNDSDYLFDSTMFEKTFSFKPTSYDEGIKETVKSLSNN
jgi:nucleoside-diphosphate-sugar epimerase